MTPLLHRTSTRLSDGRELFYFDETADARDIVDTRDLPRVEHLSQVRYDALQDEWVGFAGHRQTRTYHPPANQCPLCPSTPDNSSEIPATAYDVAVFENRFPSFAGTGPLNGNTPEGLFETRPGIGRCEVVCFTSEHAATFSDLPPRRVRTVLEALVDRTAALSAHPGVAQVFCFENRGTEIGVTLEHPHGQIYGYPYITPRTSQQLTAVQRYGERTGRNLFADTIDGELADGSRIVAQNEHWVAFVPFAARWPAEVHLYPRRQVPDLPALTDAEKDALPELHLDILHRMQDLFDDTLPAITGWHQAPVHQGRDDHWLHLQIFTIRRAVRKLKYLAGSESAMGAWVSDATPEAIAERLRAVATRSADHSTTSSPAMEEAAS